MIIDYQPKYCVGCKTEVIALLPGLFLITCMRVIKNVLVVINSEPCGQKVNFRISTCQVNPKYIIPFYTFIRSNNVCKILMQ